MKACALPKAHDSSHQNYTTHQTSHSEPHGKHSLLGPKYASGLLHLLWCTKAGWHFIVAFNWLEHNSLLYTLLSEGSMQCSALNQPVSWKILNSTTGVLTKTDPISEHNTVAMKLTTHHTNGGIANTGYWGMAFNGGWIYHFSIYIKGERDAKANMPHVTAERDCFQTFWLAQCTPTKRLICQICAVHIFLPLTYNFAGPRLIQSSRCRQGIWRGYLWGYHQYLAEVLGQRHPQHHRFRGWGSNSAGRTWHHSRGQPLTISWWQHERGLAEPLPIQRRSAGPFEGLETKAWALCSSPSFVLTCTQISMSLLEEFYL